MPAPVVIVDVAPVPDMRLASGLVAACSEAMRSGSCELAHAGPLPKEAWAIAVVTWEGDDRAQVRFETAAPDPNATRLRSVVFRQEDDPWERWRTVGFAIAMLADLVASSNRTPEPPSVAEDEKKVPAPLHPQEKFREPLLRLSVAGLVGPALDDGSIRLGAGLQAALQPFTVPMFGSASLRYAVRPEDEQGVTVRWMTMSAGVGGVVTPPALDARFSARLEAVGRFLGVEVTDTDTGRHDAEDRFTVGPLLGFDAAWPARTPIGGIASVEGSCAPRPTEIAVRQRSIGVVPACGFLGLVGLEMRFR